MRVASSPRPFREGTLRAVRQGGGGRTVRDDVTLVRPMPFLAAAALLVAGCGGLLDSSTAVDAPAPPPTVASAPESVSGAVPESAAATGTAVGEMAARQRGELDALDAALRDRRTRYDALRETARRDSADYFAQVAAISARLRVGTTPGNPLLVGQWNAAQGALDRLLADVAALNTLGNEVATDSATASYLLESVRATYALQGAVDEDHRRLAAIEDGIGRSVVLIDRTRREVRETIDRYTDYVHEERRRLTRLGRAIERGEYAAAADERSARAAVLASAASDAPRAALPARPPLVVIRFSRPDVDYRAALRTAVAAALDRHPASTFDLVAVAPAADNPADVVRGAAAKRHAEEVLAALVEMGLSESRVTLSATTSPEVSINEVRLYVR